MKTLTIDNKHYIPARVVMLATKTDTNIGLFNKKLYHSEFGSKTDDWISQHIYLVCDLPIEEGDWFIGNNIPTLYQAIGRHAEIVCCGRSLSDVKKVIATTDSFLKYGEDIPTIIRYKSLPQFSQSFIKEFAERQGKDVDVLVEVELFRNYGKVKLPCSPHNNESNSDMSIYYPEIKLNPDNTVNLIFK